jgi:anti-sigma B factor antagonist
VTAVLQLHERDVGDVTILDLRGQLVDEGDIPLADWINDLAGRGRIRILLDFAHVSRVDSTGIGVVISKYLTLRRLGGTLKLLRVGPRALYLLTITKLTTVLELFDSEEEAIRSFAPKPSGG